MFAFLIFQLFRRVAAALPGMEQTEPKRGESILYQFHAFWGFLVRVFGSHFVINCIGVWGGAVLVQACRAALALESVGIWAHLTEPSFLHNLISTKISSGH